MNFCQFHHDHLLHLNLVEEEGLATKMRETLAWRRQFYAPGALSQTAVCDGRIVACFGLTVHGWPGRGLVWAKFDRDIGPRNFLSVARRIKDMADMVLRNGFFRLETIIDPDYPRGQRFIELMGFEYEGTVRKYDGVRTYLLYSRVA